MVIKCLLSSRQVVKVLSGAQVGECRDRSHQNKGRNVTSEVILMQVLPVERFRILLSFRVCSFLLVALGAASQNPTGHSSDTGMDMGTKWGLWGIFRPPTAAGLPAIFLPPLPLRSLLLG